MQASRNFKIREGMSLNLRGEFFNVFNRTEVNNPTQANAAATPVLTASGQTTSGFGYINTGSLFSNPRSGQIVARFTF